MLGANLLTETFPLDHADPFGPEYEAKWGDKPLESWQKSDHLPATYLRHLYYNLPSSSITTIKDPVTYTPEPADDTTIALQYGSFYKFAQRPYIQNFKEAGFQDNGYLYVPHPC